MMNLGLLHKAEDSQINVFEGDQSFYRFGQVNKLGDSHVRLLSLNLYRQSESTWHEVIGKVEGKTIESLGESLG